MPIVFSCPGCAKRFEVGDNLAGKSSRCKQCGTQFKVPSPRTTAPTPPRPQSPPAAGVIGRPSPPSPPQFTPVSSAPPQFSPVDSSDDDDGLPPDPYDDDDDGYSPLPSSGLRGSRYRDQGASDSDDGPPPTSRSRFRTGNASAVTKPKRKKSVGRSLSAMPLPAVILFGGSAFLILFLAVVVYPSMQGGDAPAGAPDAFVDGGAPGAWRMPWLEDSNFPALPPPGPGMLGGIPSGPIGDLSRHEAVMKRLTGALGHMADVLSEIRDPDSARAAGSKMQALQGELQPVMVEFQSLPIPSPAESAELARRVSGEMQPVIERLRVESDRLASIPGLGPLASQLSRGANQLAAKMSEQPTSPQPFAGPGGPQPFVEVRVANVPDDVTSRYLAKLIGEAADVPPGVVQSTWSSSLSASSYRVWPVADPILFSARLTFGAATIEGRILSVRPDRLDQSAVVAFKAELASKSAPAPAAGGPARGGRVEVPSGTAPREAALLKLTSTDQFQQSEGLNELSKMIPSDDLEEREAVVSALEPFATGIRLFDAEKALHALVNWRNDHADRILIHVLKTTDQVYLRNMIFKLVLELKFVAAAEAIANLLDDDPFEAPKTLIALGPAAESAVLPHLSDADHRAKQSALRVLAEIGGRETLDAMKKMRPDPDFGIREEAQKTMQAITSRLKSEGN